MEHFFLSNACQVIPETRLSLEELARTERFETDLPMLREAQRYEDIAVADGRTQTDLAIEAGMRLLSREGVCGRELGLVFYCHHWEDEEWHRLQPFRIHAALGLRRSVDTLELKTGNGGSVLKALGLAAGLMRGDPALDNVLVLGADKINRHVMRRRWGAQIFGDGASSILLRRHAGAFRVLVPHLSVTSPSFFDMSNFDRQMEATWLEDAKRSVAQLLRELQDSVTIAPARLDAVVTGNASPTILEQVLCAVEPFQPRIHAPSRRSMADAVTSDVLINLAMTVEAGALLPGSVVLLLSVARGASYRATLLGSSR
jgi:3-oxoacyl-[acyl-carrier-protein] synthase III